MGNQITTETAIIRALNMDLAQTSYRLGKDGITKIEAYDEPGVMGYVAWFNLWRGKTLYAKLNGHFVSAIIYQEKKSDE